MAEARARSLCEELAAEAVEVLTIKSAETDGLEQAAPMARGLTTGMGTLRSRTGHQVRIGSAAEQIAARGNELDAGLVLAAVQGDRICAGRRSPCSSAELVERVERPLLLVKRPPRGGYRSVLVAVDLTEDSDEVARHALWIAPKAHLILLHVCATECLGADADASSVQRAAIARETAQGKMSSLISRLERGRRLISRVVLHGPPAATVLGYTDQLSVDLVVIGRRDEADAAQAGQMTQRLLSGLGSDLLLVPTRSYPTLPNAA